MFSIGISWTSSLIITMIIYFQWINSINGMIMKEDQPDLSSSIDINELINHLDELQKIANGANGNRAIKTVGFNRSVDYIYNYLSANTNLQVSKRYFVLRNYALRANPTLSSSIDGVSKTHLYSTNLAQAEFTHVQYSTSINTNTPLSLTVIPNLGCSDEDWLAARPVPAGRVAIVKRGDCNFEAKSIFATKYNVLALFIYNDGTAPDRFQPISINLGQNNRLPALFLSYNLGQTLITALNDPLKVVSIRLTISTDTDLHSIANVCADTTTGDVTQTILVGSHSDGVPAGSGINDNGSGTAANLAMATTLSRLLQTGNYIPYKYRVRFCWWGAEEVGLLGSKFHATNANGSSIVGERIKDNLVNINLDMIASPNFIFGIYDGKTAPTSTPASAKPGSNKITTLFQNWFVENKLPWDYTRFDGRSDYGPFLAAGIAAGGLFSGADASKTVEQRNRYQVMLGSTLAGIAGVRQDECYHKSCDKTSNINKFALEKMVRAAAYAIESMGQQSDLKTWLYPTREIQELAKSSPPPSQYDSINEYFGFPYF